MVLSYGQGRRSTYPVVNIWERRIQEHLLTMECRPKNRTAHIWTLDLLFNLMKGKPISLH